VCQKPETPEQWATLTGAGFVDCEYKPTVEDFRWQNFCGRINTALKLTLTADNFEFTFTSITERSPYFEKMSFYRYA